MSLPLEIVAQPFNVYIAPVGESFPDVDETPGGNWVLIGTSGNRNYTEDGVTVQHEQTVEEFRSLGSTGPMKVFRTSENLIISFTLADLTLENYKYALNFNTVSDTAAGSGTPGHRDIDLYLGPDDVAQRALLVRGMNASPYLANTHVQYQVPVVFEVGSKEIVSQKVTPIGLALEFRAIDDPIAASASKRFVILVAQDAAAL